MLGIKQDIESSVAAYSEYQMQHQEVICHQQLQLQKLLRKGHSYKCLTVCLLKGN